MLPFDKNKRKNFSYSFSFVITLKQAKFTSERVNSEIMKIFLGVLLASMFAVTVAQVQVNRDASEISFANFHQLAERFLNATGLVDLRFEDFSGCGLKCLHHPKCVSYNFGGSSGTSCKIFGVDRFANGSSLVEDDNYDYYYIKRVCDDNPCANNGKCVTYDEKNNFTCQCLAIFTGRTCTELTACANPLGMADGRILDSQLSMSSYFNNDVKYGEKNGRLNKNTWPYGAQADSAEANPWFKVDLLRVKYLSAVGIQGYGASDGGSYTKSFMISTTTDGSIWKMYQEVPGFNKIFAGNTDVHTEVRGHFKVPIQARAMKIIAVTCQSTCTFRLELYGC